MSTMDDLCAGLVSYLGAYAGLNALISARIYVDRLPEGRTLPALVYQIQDAPELNIANYVEPYVRFTCWSYTHTLSWQVAEQVREALNAYHGSLGTVHAYSQVVSRSDGRYEPLPAPGLYPVHVYTRVWFKDG